MILRARNTRSYMPTRYPDRAARSHGFGTPDRTCLEGIRKGLQDLMGKEHQIVNAYMVLGRGCRISRVWNNRSNMPTRYKDGAASSHGFGTPDGTCLERIRTGLQDLTGKGHQIVNAYEVSGWGFRISRVRNKFQHAYEVSGWGCRISRVRNIRSYMPTRYQDGAA